MNAFGYIVRRFFRSFGVFRSHQVRTQLSKEKQIVSEAEDLLGRLAWRDTQNIQELAGQYWKMTDFERQQERLRTEGEHFAVENDDVRDTLDSIENHYSGEIGQMKEDKRIRMEKAIDIMRAIDEVKEAAEYREGIFNGLEMKIKVLREEDPAAYGDEIRKTLVSMEQIQEQLDRDNGIISKRTAQLDSVENEVAKIEEEIDALKLEMARETADVRTEIGRLSKKVAEVSAKIGALQNLKNDLSYEVGQFLSQNAYSRNPVVRPVLKKHRAIISKILYFRRSIDYHVRLLGGV
jgi:chromosome segregation ATPase